MQYYFSLIKKFSKSRWISRMSDDRELIAEIDSFGNKTWKNKDGHLHRLDGLALERSNGSKEWYQNGCLHRLDGPAIECANGDKYWYQNDLLHRLDGPAVERANSEKLWYKNGLLHRLDGPAIERANVGKEWWKNGRRFKNKDTFFRALTKKEKEAALFSEDFLNA